LTNNVHVVIGLGITGWSCVRYLKQQNLPVVVMDTREKPPFFQECITAYPDVPVMTGQWSQEILKNATQVIVSPGVPAKRLGVRVVGDIELFAKANTTPVIAITGSNGKSTVTTLVGEMARRDNKKVAVVGNIGTPVLDLFQENMNYDLIVMELSSFQLETTYSLRPLAATVLNISPDHLDRYDHFEDYIKAKHRIYHQANNVIINKQDKLSDSADISANTKKSYFTLESPLENEFGLIETAGQRWLAKGEQKLLPVSELKIVGLHNIANVLSSLALGEVAGLSMEAMLEAIRNFSGLEHRCQWVTEKKGIRWINDSKGTNIGATQAALEGIGSLLNGKIVLLLGGDGKGADFTALLPTVKKYCRAIIVMGKDAENILVSLGKDIDNYFVETMEEAVSCAKRIAKSNDVVLLSPACSSLDQYRHFGHRGEVFMKLVKNHVG